MMLCGPHSTASLNVDDAAEIPALPAVYLWRRVLRYDSNEPSGFDEEEAWIRRQAEAPLATLRSLRLSTARDACSTNVRSSFVLLGELRIGAAYLQGKELLPRADVDRRFVLETLEGLVDAYGPVLYVGESEKLQQRIRQHLRGETGLVTRLKECGLGLKDVALSYILLDGTPENCRLQIEQLLTHLVRAPLTRKAGA